jgi:UDP-glucose 6-dehydrogenase
VSFICFISQKLWGFSNDRTDKTFEIEIFKNFYRKKCLKKMKMQIFIFFSTYPVSKKYARNFFVAYPIIFENRLVKTMH